MLAGAAVRVQAGGLAHISPGQGPGFVDSFVIAGHRPASQRWPIVSSEVSAQ